MGWIVFVFIFIIVGVALYKSSTSPSAVAAREKAQQQQAKIVCQFCHERGCVTTRRVQRAKRKTATRIGGAIVTGGASLPVTGVSKKGWVTELRCSSCGMAWDAPKAQP